MDTAGRRPFAMNQIERLREPHGYRDLIRIFSKELRLKDEDIARAVGVTPGTVRQWRADGHTSEIRRWEPIDDLRVIAIHLLRSGVVGPDLLHVWLRARNADLGYERPLDLLGAGQFDQVLKAAEALVDGPAATGPGPSEPSDSQSLPKGATPTDGSGHDEAELATQSVPGPRGVDPSAR